MAEKERKFRARSADRMGDLEALPSFESWQKRLHHHRKREKPRRSSVFEEVYRSEPIDDDTDWATPADLCADLADLARRNQATLRSPFTVMPEVASK